MRAVRSLISAGALILLSLQAGAQVYRCGNEYSATPCKGGREIDVSDPLKDPDKVQIHLCRSSPQGLIWTSLRCVDANSAPVRSEWVPRNLDFDDQVKYAASKGERDRQARLTYAPAAPVQYSPQPSRAANNNNNNSGYNNKMQCQSLDERVNWLDSLGRAGGGGYTMDWIREERRLARDKQFRLKC